MPMGSMITLIFLQFQHILKICLPIIWELRNLLVLMLMLSFRLIMAELIKLLLIRSSILIRGGSKKEIIFCILGFMLRSLWTWSKVLSKINLYYSNLILYSNKETYPSNIVKQSRRLSLTTISLRLLNKVNS